MKWPHSTLQHHFLSNKKTDIVFPFHQRKIPSRLPAAFPPVFKRIFLAASPGKILLKKNASANGKGFEITITGVNCDRRDAWPSGGSPPSLYPIIPPDSTKYRTLQLFVIKKTVPDKKQGASVPSALHGPELAHGIPPFPRQLWRILPCRMYGVLVCFLPCCQCTPFLNFH